MVGSCINGAVDVERLREFVVSGQPKVANNGKAHAKSRAEAAERVEKDRVCVESLLLCLLPCL